jgi:glucose-fructose oxidoreductase
MTKAIGYAVVGLGTVARTSALPALAGAIENSRLVAVVSGDRAKAQVVAQQFRVAACHYEEFRQCLQRDDVNAAYIALPNSLHCDYVVEAARAGVHVLCETPMAVTADECRRMIRSCQTNRVKLMIASRPYFRTAFNRALALIRTGQLGIPKTVSGDITTRVDDADSPRLQRRLGGGTVYHLGVDYVTAARRLLGAEPAQVMAMTARTSRRYGGDVDESATALIRFPDERLAHFHTSFGEEPRSTLTVFGEEAFIEITNAFDLRQPMQLRLVRRGERQEQTLDASDEVAAAISAFSSAIRDDRQPEPSAVEGLQDVRVVEAIYRSARDGRPVTLPRLSRVDGPADQEGRPPVADRRHVG